MEKHYLAWWNLENLFDVFNAPDRPAWLQKKLKAELKGWTAAVLDRKLANLASIILQMNDQKGPDILGVCEVENQQVLQMLVDKLAPSGRSYGIIHQDSHDQRGIDIAFIYDTQKYRYGGVKFSYEVLKRTATRDIFQVNLETLSGNEFMLIGNHWPARLGGTYETEPYRIIAGETLSYWLSRIQEIKGSKAPVFVMGDFNDDPFSRSLHDYALSTPSRLKAVYGRNPYLLNLMWPLLGYHQGSFVFDAESIMFDQFLVTKGILLRSAVFQVAPDSVRVEVFPGMTKGRYGTPVRYGRPSKKSSYNPAGFSDHLPISLVFTEK